MHGYTSPALIASYSVTELCADAATCVAYGANPSDRTLKTEIRTVERPLERLGATRSV